MRIKLLEVCEQVYYPLAAGSRLFHGKEKDMLKISTLDRSKLLGFKLQPVQASTDPAGDQARKALKQVVMGAKIGKGTTPQKS